MTFYSDGDVMTGLPNMTVLVAPSTPVQKVLQHLDRVIDYRKLCDREVQHEYLYAEHYDKLDKALLQSTGGRQCLETHGYRGKRLIRGQSLKKRPPRNPKLAL